DARQARTRSAALAARLPSPSLYTIQINAGDDEWRMAHDEGWDQPIDELGLSHGKGTVRAWYRAATEAAIGRVHARMGRVDRALRRLASLIPALEKAPGCAENYTRIACDAAETLWLTGHTDHLASVDRNLREKVVAPDFH